MLGQIYTQESFSEGGALFEINLQIVPTKAEQQGSRLIQQKHKLFLNLCETINDSFSTEINVNPTQKGSVA